MAGPSPTGGRFSATPYVQDKSVTVVGPSSASDPGRPTIVTVPLDARQTAGTTSFGVCANLVMQAAGNSDRLIEKLTVRMKTFLVGGLPAALTTKTANVTFSTDPDPVSGGGFISGLRWLTGPYNTDLASVDVPVRPYLWVAGTPLLLTIDTQGDSASLPQKWIGSVSAHYRDV